VSKANFSKISTYNKAEESPGLLLWKASTRWRRAIETALQPYDLTHPQFVLLATIGWLTRDGGKTTQVEVGKFAELDPNTTSQILRNLQKKGLIERQPGSDERSKSPVLTAAGVALLSQALPAVEAADRHFFSLSKQEQAIIIQLLQKLSAS
jgi:DNA-binding MarR family transcriptional regulator